MWAIVPTERWAVKESSGHFSIAEQREREKRGQRQSAASHQLAGVAILRAQPFRRWPSVNLLL